MPKPFILCDWCGQPAPQLMAIQCHDCGGFDHACAECLHLLADCMASGGFPPMPIHGLKELQAGQP